MLSVGILLVSSVALLLGKISGGDWATIATGIGVSYSFANAAGFFKNDNKD